MWNSLVPFIIACAHHIPRCARWPQARGLNELLCTGLLMQGCHRPGALMSLIPVRLVLDWPPRSSIKGGQPRIMISTILSASFSTHTSCEKYKYVQSEVPKEVCCVRCSIPTPLQINWNGWLSFRSKHSGPFPWPSCSTVNTWHRKLRSTSRTGSFAIASTQRKQEPYREIQKHSLQYVRCLLHSRLRTNMRL
jgi:hypothetical protein